MNYIATALLLALILVPSAVSAHETQTFEIGGTHYQFVIGSLNEPIVVDDKTGVDLRISSLGSHAAVGEHDHDAGTAVAGLEETLQVELSAGTEKKVLDLSPVYNTPGSYKAVFYPTVATTYSYRVFGTVHGTPVDLLFTCNAAGHSAAEEETEEVEVSEGVTRVSKTGSFGCPAPKEDMGFPEKSAAMTEVADTKGLATTGAGLGVVALLLAGYAASRRK